MSQRCPRLVISLLGRAETGDMTHFIQQGNLQRGREGSMVPTQYASYPEDDILRLYKA
jgi:hypothetical protein